MNKTIKTIIAGIAFSILLFTGAFAMAENEQTQIKAEPVTLQTPAKEVSEIDNRSGLIIGLALAALIITYSLFKKKGKKQNSNDDNVKTAELIGSHSGYSDVSGETNAAIAAAIHLYNEELHDEENTVLTINRISRTYSPWSSKIHGLNTYFNRR